MQQWRHSWILRKNVFAFIKFSELNSPEQKIQFKIINFMRALGIQFNPEMFFSRYSLIPGNLLFEQVD